MIWRKDSTYLGVRGRTEPNYRKGSADLYGTGAEICPLDDLQRSLRNPPAESRYAIYAWIKRGHLTEDREFVSYAITVEEGKRLCDEWLAANMKKTI